MQVAKSLTLRRLGIAGNSYHFWDGKGPLSFDGVNWIGRDGIAQIVSMGKVSYSLDATAKTIPVEIITDDTTLINDISFGSALSEGIIRYLYYDSDWKYAPVSFRGLLGNIVRRGNLFQFEIDSGDIDKDRIRPKIWSHQSQLKEYPNDQGFRFLPILVKGIERQFFEPIDGRNA